MKQILLLIFCFTLGNLFANQASIEQLKQQLTSQDNKAQVNTLLGISKIHCEKGEFKEAMENAKTALEKAKATKAPAVIANAYDQMGLIVQAKYDYANATKHFYKALELRNQVGDKKAIATSKNNIGKVFFLQEEPEQALVNLNEALRVRNEIADSQGAAETYKNIGEVYLFKKMYGIAKDNNRQAMDLFIQNNELNKAAEIANLMGSVATDLKDFDGALVYYRMSLDLNSSMENEAGIADDFNNIANVFITQESYEEALEANITAHQIRQGVDDKFGLAETTKNFGVIYAKLKKRKDAEVYLEQSATLLKEIGPEPGTQNIYEEISHAYHDLKNYEQAYAYQIAYANTKETIFGKEKSNALLEMSTKYESMFEAEQQKATIANLENEKSFSQKIKFALMGLVGLGALLMMVLFNSYRRKQKDNQLLVTKNTEINKQKEEIDTQNDKLEVQNASLDNLNQKLVTEMAERESIEQSSFARDRFLATMSHEMRTPMNIITGLTHLLLDENPREDQVEHLRTLQFSANNLVVFINDVLDFSKIEAGKLTLESRAFEPVLIIEEIKKRFSLPASDKQLQFTCSYDKKIPEGLMGDPTRLNQILSNLVSNAIKFTDSGKVNVDVNLHSMKGKDANLILTVSDTGVGIAKEKLDEMFKKFTRSSTDMFDGYENSGLGLAITKRLVELQNGKLDVETIQGEGTTFTVFLPFKIADEIKKKVANPDAPKSYKHLEGNKILLVEDNKINQLVVAKMLRKLGMEVVTADNGLEALDSFSNSYFDLVLMDIQMPVMDGYRTTAEIRKSTDPRKRDVPIIALTASAFLTEKEKAKLFGMNDHVGKPFGPDDLLEKITNSLSMYKV